jgi:hypothetical protein
MNNLFKFVDVKDELPTKEGKYIVKTLTKYNNKHELQCSVSITNGKVHFNVSNQIVTHWLKEI